MKKDIHPKYNSQIKAICACGHSFTTGSTLKEIKTELCSECHPFYTGKQKLVDSARRVEKFRAKVDARDKAASTRKGKKAKRAQRAQTKAAQETSPKAKTSKKTDKK
jgi:large subunit ribosomal protein L31